jgi:hypothetical protein
MLEILKVSMTLSKNPCMELGREISEQLFALEIHRY